MEFTINALFHQIFLPLAAHTENAACSDSMKPVRVGGCTTLLGKWTALAEYEPPVDLH